MRILGFDPGLATVGYGVIESDGRNNVAVDYGVIKTPPDENTAVRLAMIDAAAAELMDRFRPDAVAEEELFFQYQHNDRHTGSGGARRIACLCGKAVRQSF